MASEIVAAGRKAVLQKRDVPVSMKARRWKSWSVRAWMLVVRPPHQRPIAWLRFPLWMARPY